MVRLGATNYETSWERDLDDADESLASHLYKAAALSAYLSVRGFIWELHFDTDDFVFTIPKGFGRYFDPYEEGAEVCMSSVDFARNYLSIPSNMDPQERKTFLARLRETDPILFRCYDKFRGLDREDDFLLSQAENQHVVNQHEAEAI